MDVEEIGEVLFPTSRVNIADVNFNFMNAELCSRHAFTYQGEGVAFRFEVGERSYRSDVDVHVDLIAISVNFCAKWVHQIVTKN